jgi:tRNA U54 and U55 pseudouridine synthase Pus10
MSNIKVFSHPQEKLRPIERGKNSRKIETMMRLKIHGDASKHEEELEGECETCGGKFRSFRELDEHVESMHKGIADTNRGSDRSISED